MTEDDQDQNTVLAIFSHSDDELGCAGTLANHSEAGDEVILAFLTKGENSTSVDGDTELVRKKREQHTKKISDLLGVKIRYMDFTDSRIAHTVENGYKVAELIREVKPDIIITWNIFARTGAGHPDHRNTARIVYDAVNYARYQNPDSDYEPHREPVSLYRYHNPKKGEDYELEFIDVSEQAEKIEKFIDIYKEAYGDWPVEEFKFNSLGYYGRLADVKYAEVFEVIQRDNTTKKLLE